MRIIADLHIHSKYSRACSKELELKNIDKYCRIKGVDIIATGDFTHPAWFSDIKTRLEPSSEGLFKLKDSDGQVHFILSTELSCIYKRGDKARRLHMCIMAPNIESVEKLIQKFEQKGFNLKSDGRPILGLDVEELTKYCLDIDEDMFIFPAHIWTPWFAMFGSKSGFDSMEECFGEMTKYIHAIETGLSSNPQMNWRVSNLDKMALISNSDAHSLPNIAREANIFNLQEISYSSLVNAIKSRDKTKFIKTIEFYPEEGMYHYDGHRDCNVMMEPNETKKHQGICPNCKKPLTVGVLNRVEELADRPQGYIDEDFVPDIKLVELDKIIAEVFNIKSRKSQKVLAEYNRLISEIGPELKILMDVSLDELENHASANLVEGIRRVRNGEMIIEGGYDGQYGVVKIFSEKEREDIGQRSLF